MPPRHSTGLPPPALRRWFAARVLPAALRVALLVLVPAIVPGALPDVAAQARTPGTVSPSTVGPAASPPGFTALRLADGVRAVHDGDTFAADLDGDGTLALSRERVRLLYVDTPELGESAKGRDPRHGEPARVFLAALLERRPIVLYVPDARPTGHYGRTLAWVWVGGEDVSLALIRAGHSYFYTRFQVPPGAGAYAAYAAAEGEAFAARRGIWRDAGSRRRYLARLKRELKTPAAPGNALYVPGVQPVRTLRPAGLLGRYVHLEGTVAEVRTLSKGVRRVMLERAPGQAPFPAVVFPRYAARLGVEHWAPGTSVHLEGFLQKWRGEVELVLHYGEVGR